MNDTDSGEKLIRKFPLSFLVTAPDNTIGSIDRIFPKGRYELEVNLRTPLVSSSSGGILPSAGLVTINLKSHNISAEIEYKEDFAVVTYDRNGEMKQVRVNSDLTISDF